MNRATAHCLVALLLTLLGTAIAEGSCVTKDEIQRIMSSSDERATKALTNVPRFPGTASTKLMRDMEAMNTTGRYRSYLSSEGGCDYLCFDAPWGCEDDPFVQLTKSFTGVHSPWDEAMQYKDNSSYKITTIREPFQYARKFYTFRKSWDQSAAFPPELTFSEWMKIAPWRSNQMTRMLGRENLDKRVMPKSMLDSPDIGERSDRYIQEQNKLGEDSEILAKAWDRLKEYTWFGIFHRLKESYELLAFVFCFDDGWGFEKDQILNEGGNSRRAVVENVKNQGTGRKVLKLMQEKGQIDINENIDKIAEELTERNQLDLILLERAEALLDERLREMKDAKANGTLCRFMNTVDVTCMLNEMKGKEDVLRADS